MQRVIGYGARRIVVPGNFPIGCFPSYLTLFQTTDSAAYDELHCLKELNNLAIYHNQHLQQTLEELKMEYPDVVIVYGDYFSAYMWILQNVHSLGEFFVSCILKSELQENYPEVSEVPLLFVYVHKQVLMPQRRKKPAAGSVESMISVLQGFVELQACQSVQIPLNALAGMASIRPTRPMASWHLGSSRTSSRSFSVVILEHFKRMIYLFFTSKLVNLL